ncbi:hypothetical protein [Cryptosporangium aurantiacum]|uniref:Uncharacterized protein n=1 Tax=Cryptosporangium aurantiacum TaxID=134849 RepID=A0A1M7RNY0_9ACTN|nr:hypothetical protein [Cryptosporangium aurantiacum]SHN47802.1 hypothetical protein SAMN05443668_12832 [Cryptosporangium aurantiacum]
MESGPAPAHPLTEPGRTTVQLLVASSAVLALVQLVAATSVDVYNGERAGWWVAIQGATVAFAAAFAGAAASANGAWWRRTQQKAGSTTPGSLGTGVAAASVAGAVFSMLCWASTSLGSATYPMVVAVFVAALLGGVFGGVRAGGAVLGGLVATFAATLVNLSAQALIALFSLAPDNDPERGTPLVVSAIDWGISSAVGAVIGVWWLSRRRQRTWWSHWMIVGLFPLALVVIGDLAELLAWLMVDDPAKGDALAQAAPGHGVQLLVMGVVGGLTAYIAGRSLRAHPEWLARTSKSTAGDAVPAATAGNPATIPAPRPAPAPTPPPQPASEGAGSETATVPLPTVPRDVDPADRPTVPIPTQPAPPTPPDAPRASADTPPAPPARSSNGVIRTNLTALIPTQSQRQDTPTQN